MSILSKTVFGLKASAIGFAAYALSPVAQIAVMDRAGPQIKALLTNTTIEEGDTPDLIRHMALLRTVTSDGLHITDPFNYWKAEFHPERDQHLCDAEMGKYYVRVSEDNAYWLSKVTGVDAEVLLPAKDSRDRKLAEEIYLYDHNKDEINRTGREYGGYGPEGFTEHCR